MTSQSRETLTHDILNHFKAVFADNDTISMVDIPLDDTVITLAPKNVHEAAELMFNRFNFRHLSAITGDDTGEGVCLLYHFWHGFGITLRVVLPYDQLTLPTLTDFIPGALFYEREIAEMLGVTFEGHPNPAPLFLPDDWDGQYPLRKAGN